MKSLCCLIPCAFLSLSALADVGEIKPPRVRAQGLSRVVEFYPDLDASDPRSLAFKVRSLMRDEYSYFRGMAPSFYQAASPAAEEWLAQESNQVLLHGDIHIGNVGTYQGPGPAGKDIHFSVVDLDEVIEGPFQLDLLRALTSIRFGWQTVTAQVPWDQVAIELCAGYEDALSGGTRADSIVKRPVVQRLVSKAEKNRIRSYLDRYATGGAQARFRPARIKGRAAKDLLDPLSPEDRDRVLSAVWNYLKSGCDAQTRESYRISTEPELRECVADLVRWTRVDSSGSQGVQKYLVLLRHPLKADTDDLILELKEEPIPSAFRAGLLKAPVGPGRAEQVAQAYRLLLNPPPRLMGFTSMGQRGFLVRTKDPWGEELEPADFGKPGKESALAAAQLMGEVLGVAHRNGLVQREQPQRIDFLRSQMKDLPLQLAELSQSIENALRDEFRALKADPAAKDLVARAESLIQSFKE